MKLKAHKPNALSGRKSASVEVIERVDAIRAHLTAADAKADGSAGEGRSEHTNVAVLEAEEEPEAEPPGSAIPAQLPARQPQVILKRLSLKHRNAISLLMQGVKRVDVAEAVGFTKEYISMLLQQPLAKDYIAQINRAQGVRMEALTELSVNAIADGLVNPDMKVALAAAQMQLKATGRDEPDPGAKRTAEDVVGAILAGGDVNIQVNNYRR